MNKVKRVLVVAAHPDDETIGCGGTIAKYVKDGVTVSAIFFTDGVGSRGASVQDAKSARSFALTRASNLLGFDVLAVYDYPDNRLDTIPLLDIVKLIESEIDQYKPDIVYTHFSGDLNVDHRIIAEAVMTACRPQPQSSVKGIYSFEVPSSTGWASSGCDTNFSPTRYVDITDVWDSKKVALSEYKEELRKYPHARSMEAIEYLARFRGSMVGIPMAEAFIVEREII